MGAQEGRRKNVMSKGSVSLSTKPCDTCSLGEYDHQPDTHGRDAGHPYQPKGEDPAKKFTWHQLAELNPCPCGFEDEEAQREHARKGGSC